MNIVVLAKLVPDTEARLSVGSGRVDLAGVEMVISPFDEYALEEALRIKDANADTKITVLMAGPESAKKQITNLLALGADEAVVVDDAVDAANPAANAKVLAAEVRKLNATIVLAGKQGVDYDWGMTAVAVAVELGWPHVGVVKKFEPDFAGGAFKAVSESDEGDLTFAGKLPAVVTADKALNMVRYASLKGIMAAKKKPVQVLDLAGLGLDAAAIAPRVSVTAMELPPARPAVRMIEGDPDTQAKELIRLLHEEAKVI
jgi:electron transfer flavoprotein beta subunit